MSQTHLPVSEDPTTSAPPESATGSDRKRSDRKRAYSFRGSSFGVVRLEDLHEIANLKADLVACYRPVNSQELFALERMAIAQQLILRAARLDAGLFTSAMNDVLDRSNDPIIPMDVDMVGDGDIEITRAQNRNYCIAEGFRRIAKESNLMNLVLRYRIQSERDYRRALEEFQRLERLRPKLPNEPDLLTDTDAPDDVAPLKEINRFIRDEPVKSTPVKSEPVSVPAAPPADLPSDVSARRTASLPYIPQPKPSSVGPQAFFTKSTALTQSAGPFEMSSHPFRNNPLVPVLESEGSRSRQPLVYSNIRAAELLSARPPARAPRMNTPSVHRRSGRPRNSETVSRASGNTCRKNFSCGCGSSSGSPPSVFHSKPHS